MTTAIYRQAYHTFTQDPEAFWLNEATRIDWHTSPKIGHTQDQEGLSHWFSDGLMNTSYLALDHHVHEGRGEQAALIYDSPVTNTKRKISLV